MRIEHLLAPNGERSERGEATHGPIQLARERLNVLWRLAKILVETGYLPDGVDRPGQALLLMLKGQELGLPPLQSLASIHVIDGTPVLSGSLLMALCVKQADCTFEAVRQEADGAEVTICRPGWPPYTATFTREDAERAGVLEKECWKRYPKAMYWWRAVSIACRTVCPDVVGGLYTPEEVDGPGEVDPETGGRADGPHPEDGETAGLLALADRYLGLWTELVPEDRERRDELRARFEEREARLPGPGADWDRRHYVHAIRKLEREGWRVVDELEGDARMQDGGEAEDGVGDP